MALSNHLAQGGQTFLHKVRMLRQVLGLAFRLGIGVGLLVFDLYYYSKRSGGLNHIATLLSELIASIDILRVIDLAKCLNEKAWVQRLGYTLDHIETEDEDKRVMITEKLLEYLSNKMKLYVPMEPGIDRKGYPRNKKWKIIENVKIESDI
jgi:hypothetical protein